jgi:hypothetical protein
MNALANEDRLPHDRAVWRDYENDGQHAWDPPAGANGQRVSVEFDSGWILPAWAHMIDWHGAKRWRFGWPPA